MQNVVLIDSEQFFQRLEEILEAKSLQETRGTEGVMNVNKVTDLSTTSKKSFTGFFLVWISLTEI